MQKSRAVEVFRGIDVDALNDFLHDADDIAATDGDPLCLSLESAVPLVSEDYDLEHSVAEQLLRYHAVPAYVNEGGGVGGGGARSVPASDIGGGDEAKGMVSEPQWRGFWPHRLANSE